ncbi:TIGR02757 family protein [Sediminispirochaeta bajacaliforniensis]|uniref:TIGR02757 family protein n=1 Tax=Sediminispirochaeta bajacaliforniensis TaxID=148 RepID=UPI00037722FC|nr:TIGR02757 family protein [Sediminispirochaeta bajacaliforniensis]
MFLEDIYRRYHRRVLIEPDPLQTVYYFSSDADRELFGLIAAAFSVGRVGSILRALEEVRCRLANPVSPAASLLHSTAEDLAGDFSSMRYRFFSGDSIALLMIGLSNLLKTYGSLQAAFMCNDDAGPDIHGRLAGFVRMLYDSAGGYDTGARRILPNPDAGSACKRLHLFLRWMIRRDEIDPGCWSDRFSPATLLVPLDTHMLQVSRRLGLTIRKDGSLRTAREITGAFREFAYSDPVRYDFSVTRIGIRGEIVQWPVLTA